MQKVIVLLYASEDQVEIFFKKFSAVYNSTKTWNTKAYI